MLASGKCAQIFSAEPQLGKVAHGTARRTACGTAPVAAQEVARGIACGTADRIVDGFARGISQANALENSYLPPTLELEVAVPLKSWVLLSF